MFIQHFHLKCRKIAEQAIKNRFPEQIARMKKNGIKNPDPQYALISLDVQTGGILAMAGGKNYSESSFNRAVSALRQPGSAFKPIVYANAIERGFPQNMIVSDSPIAYKNSGNKNDYWKPENFSRTYLGEITLRKALSLSKNIPAVRLMEILGTSSVTQFARKFGIKSKLTPYLSLALGTSEMTLLEITSAYSVFPSGGQHIEPFGINHVIDYSERIISNIKPVKRVAMSSAAASVMTNMLEGVVKEGTGKKARAVGRPVGGKTGTTNKCRDALFIGFSPTIVTGVWVGLDRSDSLGPF